MTLIHEQLLKVSAQIGPIAKEREMAQGDGFKFRGIDEFLTHSHPAFLAHEVTCTPEVLEMRTEFHDRRDRQGNVYGFWTHVFLRVRFTFEAADGSQRVAVTAGEGLDLSDKATNKAMSGALKYALVQSLTIPTKALDEQDADQRPNDSYDPNAQPRQQQARQRAQQTRTASPSARTGARSSGAKERSSDAPATSQGTPAPKADRDALADTIAGAPDEVQREMKAWCVEHGVKLRNAACTVEQLDAARAELGRLSAS